MQKSNKIKLIILAFVLVILAFLIITFKGNTYIYKVNINSNINSLDSLNIIIEQDDDIIKIVDKSLADGILKLKLKSLKKGKAYIEIMNDDVGSLEAFYVHNFGIITSSSYFGKSSGDIVIPIFTLIYLVFILYILIKNYQENLNNSLYQYKNITYLGGIIFLFALFIHLLITLFSYNGILNMLESLISSVQFFSFIIFPLAFIVSIFVIISNLKLLKREGFAWKNMLGIILGIIVIITTIFPDIIYNFLYSSTIVDIHNEQGIALYVHKFLETSIFICLTYLECILLGTIVLSIKAAKNIPKYDKDYIIILGCKIRKDGTLTPLLKGRVDKAIEFARLQKENTNKDIIFIPSGGKGIDEPLSEAEAMQNYLIKQGIDDKKIIIENKAINTYENIKFSYALIKEKDVNIAFATTNYHVFRAGNIAYNQNINLEGIGSKTKNYFWINAFIREFIATIYAEKKKHLIILALIMLINILMILITYLSNIM